MCLHPLHHHVLHNDVLTFNGDGWLPHTTLCRYDDDTAAKDAELEMLASDLERANQRFESVQKELATERERMATQLLAPGASGAVENEIDAMSVANLEKELTRKELEINQLIDNHRELQRDQVQMKNTFDTRISGYEAALQTSADAAADLKKQMAAQSDYETVKSELEILKSVEFGNVPTDGTESLEAILMRKNRALEAENTDVKIRSSELTARLESLESSTGTSSAKVNEQASLIAQLETDLSVLQDTSVKGEASDAPGVPFTLDSPATKPDGGDSLLSIVSSQRDRFRNRNIEIEAESRQQVQTATALRKEIDTLRSDNVKLYEKIKFVQGYKTTNRSGDDAVNKYSQAYEEKLNPFTEFSAAEKKRKLQSMNLADKLVHTVSRVVLGSSRGRLIFVSYIMVLHALTFMVLLRFSHHTTTQTNIAEICLARFANHMHLPQHKEFFEDAGLLDGAGAVAAEIAAPAL
jgi:homeobox protein cut-like